MLLHILGTSLLGNILAGKGISRVGKRVVGARYGNLKNGFLMPSHPLNKSEIQKYYHNRDDLPKFIGFLCTCNIMMLLI